MCAAIPAHTPGVLRIGNMALLTYTALSQKSLTASSRFLSELEVEKRVTTGFCAATCVATNKMHLVKSVQFSEFSVQNEYSTWQITNSSKKTRDIVTWNKVLQSWLSCFRGERLARVRSVGIRRIP